MGFFIAKLIIHTNDGYEGKITNFLYIYFSLMKDIRDNSSFYLLKI